MTLYFVFVKYEFSIIRHVCMLEQEIKSKRGKIYNSYIM